MHSTIRPLGTTGTAAAVKLLTELFQDRPIFLASYANDRAEARKYPPRDKVITDPATVADFLERYDEPGRACYFAVNEMEGNKRGKDHIAAINAHHIDIDFKTTLADRAKIEDVLAKMPLPPSAVVMSGHGFHCYWLLDQPIGAGQITSHENRNRMLCDLLAGDYKAAEAARVLRLPGSHNTKDGDSVAVELMPHLSSWKRYTVAEMERWMLDAPVLIEGTKPPEMDTDRGINRWQQHRREGRKLISNFDADEILDNMRMHDRHGNGIDDSMTRIVGAMVRQGAALDEVTAMLLPEIKLVFNRDRVESDGAWNERKERQRIKAKFNYFSRKDAERKKAEAVTRPDTDDRPSERTKTKSVSKPSIIIVRADKIIMRPKQWIWERRILRGALDLTSGLPGLGKSQVQIDAIGRATTGVDWPDGAKNTVGPMDVIMLTAEDALDQEVIPRLNAVKADLARVHIIKCLRRDDKNRQFLLGEDLDVVKEAIHDIGNIGLMTLDPITAYMGGKLDSHNNTAVRSQLGPLKDFAEEMDIAVSAITHPPKGGSQRAMDSFIGSQAFIAAGRVGNLCVEEMEHDEELNEKLPTGRILFCNVKNNAAQKATTLAYRVEQITVQDDENPYKSIIAPHVVWEKEVDITADAALGLGGKHRGGGRGEDQTAARKFLYEMLKEGKPVAQKEIEAQAAPLGFSAKQLRSARVDMGIHPTKTGFKGGWEWKYNPPKAPTKGRGK